jgi:hypothetical protein
MQSLAAIRSSQQQTSGTMQSKSPRFTLSTDTVLGLEGATCYMKNAGSLRRYGRNSAVHDSSEFDPDPAENFEHAM